jgi:hypothetical protein
MPPINTSASESRGAPRLRTASPQTQVGIYLMLLAMTATNTLRTVTEPVLQGTESIAHGFSYFKWMNSEQLAMNDLATSSEAAEQLARVEQDSDAEPEAESDHASYVETQDPPTDDTVMEIEEDETMEIEEDCSSGSCSFAENQSPSTFVRDARIGGYTIKTLPAEILATVLDYLPLREVNAARAACSELAGAANMVAPQPFGRGVTFVRCSELSRMPKPQPNPHALPTAFVWRCVNCCGYSNYHEQCTWCGANVRQSGCRVFLGQVRKQHTVEATIRMLRMLCPEVCVLHIESHSNKDGYEKGAAWLYVDTPEQAQQVVDLHKRVFFDCDANGEEGFWYAEDPTAIEHLAEFAALRKNDDVRKTRPLASHPLVAEFPSSSMMKNGTTVQPLRSAVKASMVRDSAGWYHADK